MHTKRERVTISGAICARDMRLPSPCPIKVVRILASFITQSGQWTWDDTLCMFFFIYDLISYRGKFTSRRSAFVRPCPSFIYNIPVTWTETWLQWRNNILCCFYRRTGWNCLRTSSHSEKHDIHNIRRNSTANFY